MKKMLRICLLTTLCMTFVTLGGFLALTWYYGRTFVVNTWINGIYCTGMTVEEVNGELVRSVEIPELAIIDGQGQSWILDLSLADYRVDYTESLQAYLRHRGRTSWLNPEEEAEQHLFPRTDWDREKLREMVAGMDWVQAAQNQSAAVEIRPGEEGAAPYVLYDGKSNRLDSFFWNCRIRNTGWMWSGSAIMYSSAWRRGSMKCGWSREIATQSWRIRRRMSCRDSVLPNCSPFAKAI